MARKYEVYVSCHDECPDYEDTRLMWTTESPTEAIDKAYNHKDKLHYAHIKVLEEGS